MAYVKYLATHYAAEVQAAREKAAAEKPAVEAPVEPQPVADGEAKTDEPTAESTAAVEPVRVIPDRLPLFILGESMGGAVATLTASDGSIKVDGVILIAPMYAIDPVRQPICDVPQPARRDVLPRRCLLGRRR